MQYDICLKTTSLAALIAALAPFGLTSQDEDGNAVLTTASHDHALAYAGRVVATPAEIDNEGNILSEATYLPGEYAVLRAEDTLLGQITVAPMAGVEVMDDPPAGCPTFGGWIQRPAQPTAAQRIAEAVAARTLEAASACSTVLSSLRARFASGEELTWQAQLAEARAILADPALQATSYPTIAGIIAVTGETAADFAAAVIKNNDDWTAVTAYVIGQRQAFVAALKTAAAAEGATVADVLAVPLSITLPA